MWAFSFTQLRSDKAIQLSRRGKQHDPGRRVMSRCEGTERSGLPSSSAAPGPAACLVSPQREPAAAGLFLRSAEGRGARLVTALCVAPPPFLHTSSLSLSLLFFSTDLKEHSGLFGAGRGRSSQPDPETTGRGGIPNMGVPDLQGGGRRRVGVSL